MESTFQPALTWQPHAKPGLHFRSLVTAFLAATDTVKGEAQRLHELTPSSQLKDRAHIGEVAPSPWQGPHKLIMTQEKLLQLH